MYGAWYLALEYRFRNRHEFQKLNPISEIGLHCRPNTEVLVMKAPNHVSPKLGFWGRDENLNLGTISSLVAGLVSFSFFFCSLFFIWSDPSNPLARKVIVPFQDCHFCYWGNTIIISKNKK